MNPCPRLPLRRRTLLAGAAALCATAASGCRSVAAPVPATGRQRLRLLGEATFPVRMKFKGTTFGGLSGLDFDPVSGLWAALSDDRSELEPARFYTLRVQIHDGQRMVVEPLDVITLRQAAGTPFPPRSAGGEVVDPEAMRLLPGGRGLLWASEGDPKVNQSPGLREARIDGSHVRDFTLPPMLQLGPRPGIGPRDNLSFEGLALTPDARGAWVSMEAALQQDGPVPKVGAEGGPCRLTLFDLASGRATRQIAYIPDAIPSAPPMLGGFADNGISEILMIDARRMLVLERAFMMGIGNSLRLYEIDTEQASDTLAADKLVAGQYRPAAKRLVADFSQVGLAHLDNTEAMTWGPPLPNGQRCLVFVSDDNFNPLQITQFAAFEYLD